MVVVVVSLESKLWTGQMKWCDDDGKERGGKGRKSVGVERQKEGPS